MSVVVETLESEHLHPESSYTIAEVVRKRFDGVTLLKEDYGDDYYRCFPCDVSFHAPCLTGDVLACPFCHEAVPRLQQEDRISRIHQARHGKECPYGKKRPKAPQ